MTSRPLCAQDKKAILHVLSNRPAGTEILAAAGDAHVAGTKTYVAKPGEIAEKWWVVDASDKVVGRLASEIAVILMGKHRPQYTPHVLCGDSVVVINAKNVKFTGK